MNVTTYKEHYSLCRSTYGIDLPKDRKYDSLYDLTVDPSILKGLDKELISKIHEKFCYKIDNNIDCSKETHATRVNNWHDIEEIKTLTDSFMPIVEQQIFSCNVAIEFLLPYRNTPSKIPMKSEWDTENLESSWKWHYDDTPNELLKVFLYLNEVTENSGCLKYLTDKEGKTPVIESLRTAPDYHSGPQTYAGSRIPPEVIKHNIEEKGWKINNVVGPAGTCVIHSPNIYHRASCPTPNSTPRDVLFFLLRPKLSRQKSYINKQTKPYHPAVNTKRYDLD